MTTSYEWMTEAGRQTLEGGYLLPGEDPKALFTRAAKASAGRINRPDLAPLFLDAMERNWLCLASPVASNLGTDRGLPISCFGVSVPDSVDGIYDTAHEMAMMGKNGGGIGVCLSNVRGRGEPIRNNGFSDGIVPWAKVYDIATWSVSQGSTRRGAGSVNLNVEHRDIREFLKIRRPEGDPNRQCLNLNHAVQVTDDFMSRVEAKDPEARDLWREMMRTRMETGEPYVQFIDTVNAANPEVYREHGLRVEMTNICSEIALHSDERHSFVCCLSSLNLARWEEWRSFKFPNGMTLPRLATWFLQGVMQEFLDRATDIPHMERALRGARRGRPLGLGVLGWHTLLQSQGLPFDSSVEVMGLNSRIFSFMQKEAQIASREFQKHLRSPQGRQLCFDSPWDNEMPWTTYGEMANTHLMAVAPTATNSIISGGLSAGIEPIAANAFAHKTAKGTFTVKNPTLEAVLDRLGKNTPEVWRSIVGTDGSVQHLDFLSDHDKAVFLTAREISQFHIVKQAAGRTPYIDQGQSINLFFPHDVKADYFHKVHMEAWRSGVKSLYYCRSTSPLKADVASRYYDEECTACEG